MLSDVILPKYVITIIISYRFNVFRVLVTVCKSLVLIVLAFRVLLDLGLGLRLGSTF